MVFRDSFADFCGVEVLYNEETTLIRMLLCVQQLHAKGLLEAGIYIRCCIGSLPVRLHGPLPKQCSLACKNTHTISDHLRSQVVIWKVCTYGILIDFPCVQMLSCWAAIASWLFSLLYTSYDVERGHEICKGYSKHGVLRLQELDITGSAQSTYQTEQTSKAGFSVKFSSQYHASHQIHRQEVSETRNGTEIGLII